MAGSGSPAAGWWLLEAPTLSPAANMALDHAVLDHAVGGDAVGGGAVLDHAIDSTEPVAVVRIYRWRPAALSVGAHSELPPGILERCAAAGVAVVRRPTGGGCVLHDADLTYSVVAPDGGRGVLEAYRWVAAGLIAGLGRLGIAAAIAEHGPAGRPLNCFQVPTGADLAVAGRKLCGSAQLRRGWWFLQHGSIPVSDVRARTAELLGSPPDDRSTFLECVKPGTTWEDLAAAIVEGFAAAWGSSPRRRQVDPEEWHLCKEERATVQANHAVVA
ncbi:MAG: lipoate--protein ligase family protein [Actinomycetota bacterium]